MLVLSRAEIEPLLDPDRLREALRVAFVALSRGEASLPPRVAATVPAHDGWLGVMAAYLPEPPILSTKLVSLYPRNADAGRETHHAIIVVFDSETGLPIALLDGTAITAARTAAASALATDLLARPDSAVLAILGTGVQARAHARAVARVRPFRRISVAGRDAGRRDALAAELEAELAIAISAARDYADALAEADVVCAATHSPEPVVRRAWLRPGAHVNSVGFNTAGREVDGATVRDALVVVESRAAALAEPPAGSNDLRWAVRDGDVGPDFEPAELGELIEGDRPGRSDPGQITLYKSVGVAVEDAAAAALVLREAAARGVGSEVAV